ncbi:MAG: hypothetical protein FWH08_03415 [Oscillospiraceae bacterium]|nr:hypothetical protein [Oscillospiraceae bacterium]
MKKTSKTILASITAIALMVSMISTVGCTSEEVPATTPPPETREEPVSQPAVHDLNDDDDHDHTQSHSHDYDCGCDYDCHCHKSAQDCDCDENNSETNDMTWEQFLTELEDVVDLIVDITEKIDADPEDSSVFSDFLSAYGRLMELAYIGESIYAELEGTPELAVFEAEVERISEKLPALENDETEYAEE